MAHIERLVAPETLKTILGIPQSDTTDDDRLDMAAEAATQMIQAHCGRYFFATDTATARIFRADTPWLVEVDDISSTVDLVVKTDEDEDGVFETTWAAGDYQLEPLNGLLSGQNWPYTRLRAIKSREWPIDGPQALIQITARWGWRNDDPTLANEYLPHPVQQAAEIQGVSLFKSADAPLGIAGFGDIGIMRLRQALHPVAMALLAPYRKDPVLVA